VFTSVNSNLAPPSKLTTYVLPEETIVYDRTARIELARFGDAKREVVQFDEIPKVLLDATTAVEDKTFWDNAGFDPVAIVSAADRSCGRQPRRVDDHPAARPRTPARPDLVQDPHRTAERKLKEIIQSIRITQAFPGARASSRSSPPTSTRTTTATRATA
jgi:penicillin-binding protein 1A